MARIPQRIRLTPEQRRLLLATFHLYLARQGQHPLRLIKPGERPEAAFRRLEKAHGVDDLAEREAQLCNLLTRLPSRCNPGRVLETLISIKQRMFAATCRTKGVQRLLLPWAVDEGARTRLDALQTALQEAQGEIRLWADVERGFMPERQSRAAEIAQGYAAALHVIEQHREYLVRMGVYPPPPNPKGNPLDRELGFAHDLLKAVGLRNRQHHMELFEVTGILPFAKPVKASKRPT